MTTSSSSANNCRLHNIGFITTTTPTTTSTKSHGMCVSVCVCVDVYASYFVCICLLWFALNRSPFVYILKLHDLKLRRNTLLYIHAQLQLQPNEHKIPMLSPCNRKNPNWQNHTHACITKQYKCNANIKEYWMWDVGGVFGRIAELHRTWSAAFPMYICLDELKPGYPSM